MFDEGASGSLEVGWVVGVGVGMGTVAYVCVDGSVVCASSVGGGEAGLAGEAFMMA